MLYALVHQQMNIISFIVLLLFSFYAFSVLDKKAKINRYYLASLYLNLVILILEVTFFMSILQYGLSSFATRIIGICSYTISPILPYLVMKLVCLYFPSPYKIPKTTKLIFRSLIIINFLFAIFVFNFELSNGRYKTNSVIVSFALSAVFSGYALYVIIKNKKALLRIEFILIASINIISTALILFQFIFKESRFILITSSFTLVLLFIVIQQKELYRDTLTGARNRLALKKCLSTKRQDQKISIVMIDLDYFKNINDTYGHAEGDYVLRVFARMLQKVYSEKGVVIRMGGDEFLILVYNVLNDELTELSGRMTKLIDRYNNRGLKPYRIKYSCASGVYDNSDISIDQFIHEVDLQMYQNKKKKRVISTNKDGKIFSAEPFI